MPTPQGAIRLFRLFGIEVFLHWSWFLVAMFEISGRAKNYSSLAWNAAEYLALFFIVLLHEFGHSLACRSVGGKANQIVLWPLGGVAYVSPPQRPGATLWSIAAGPLVNVVLLPILTVPYVLAAAAGWQDTMPNAYHLLKAVALINVILLVFNLLPIYPLDGGQILRSLLWFLLGQARSLMVAAVVGFVGVAGLILLAAAKWDLWLGILSAFILMSCWGGLLQAQAMARAAKAPRREGFACPSCHAPPPRGAFWKCAKCMKGFDAFETGAVCPNCRARFAGTGCLDCGAQSPMSEWTFAQWSGSPPPRL